VCHLDAPRLSKWWLPDAVVVVDELPHGAIGKLNELALRQKYQDYLIDNPTEPGS
jgi:non-ribosomal peptide synthetase component E (peptide arylation enzyme)